MLLIFMKLLFLFEVVFLCPASVSNFLYCLPNTPPPARDTRSPLAAHVPKPTWPRLLWKNVCGSGPLSAHCLLFASIGRATLTTTFFIPLVQVENKLQVKLWPKMNCTQWNVATKSSGVLSGFKKPEDLWQNLMAIIGQVHCKRRKQKMHISELKHSLLISFIRKCILIAIPLPKRLSKWPNI